jgi:hypothetical protein
LGGAASQLPPMHTFGDDGLCGQSVSLLQQLGVSLHLPSLSGWMQSAKHGQAKPSMQLPGEPPQSASDQHAPAGGTDLQTPLTHC